MDVRLSGFDKLPLEPCLGRRSAAAAIAGARELRPVTPKCGLCSACPAFDCGSLAGCAGSNRGVVTGLCSLGLADSEGPSSKRAPLRGGSRPVSGTSRGDICCDKVLSWCSGGGDVCGVIAVPCCCRPDAAKSALASFEPCGVNGGDCTDETDALCPPGREIFGVPGPSLSLDGTCKESDAVK